MAEDLFNKLAQEEPDRENELDEDDIRGVSISSEQAENLTPNDSDLQTTLKMLNPKFSEPELQDIAPIIMQGRIFPDNFFSKVHLMAIASAKANRHNKKFNYIFTLMKIEGMCQIGLEGKDRVETVIVSGNTKEVAEQESNKMGGNF